MLMVRSTLQDLDIIEATIQALNAVPPQINIKCKFVEVPQDDTKALGFEWNLGDGLLTNGVAEVVPGATNQLQPSAQRNPSTSPFTSTGILTDPQFRVAIKALQQRSGTELLAQPEVTTISGRQAQMKAVDIKAVVKSINERALTPPGITATNGDESSLYVTEQMELGPVLDVIPSVLPDGYTIALTVIPTVTEFLGYEEDRTNRVAVYVNGKKKSVIPPQPKFRVCQMSTSVRVWDGQTAVLGGLLSETVKTIKDQVPLLCDLPLVGRFFRSESKTTSKKNLLVFITPTLIDAVGNRIHSEKEMPAAHDGIPPQVPR
jgi:general secretion pathway protein D